MAVDLPRRNSGVTTALTAIGLAVILFLSACSLLPGAEEAEARAETQSDIETFVSNIEKKIEFPYQLDSVTIVETIEVEAMKTHYYYTVTDKPWSEDFGGYIRDMATESICENGDLKSFVDRGVTLTYEYYFEVSKRTFGLNMGKVNCSS